jgi:hypothetical protein
LWFGQLLPVGFVAPEIGCERAFLADELPGAPRIVDNRLDLAAMTDNAFILEQAVDVALGETRDPVEAEVMKRGAEVRALGHDRAPAQSGLEAFQAQFLEQATIVADRVAPFRIVVAEKFRRGSGPAASQPAIAAQDRGAHVVSPAESSAADRFVTAQSRESPR